MPQNRRSKTALSNDGERTGPAETASHRTNAAQGSGDDPELTKARKARDELQELRKEQPWNPIIRAATKLLSEDSALKRWSPEILRYTYSACPLVDGRWYRPATAPTCFWKLSGNTLERDQDALRNCEPGPVPLGIVLENVFEVAIRDLWSQGSKQGERLIPVAILEPGALLGAFEFCDLLATIPSLGNYEVSAGSRAFKIVRRNSGELRLPTGAFFKSLPENQAESRAWREGFAGHDALVRYHKLDDGWTAGILVFTKTPVPISSDERDFLDVVQNAAWQQSRHLREGHLRWLRHEFVPSNVKKRGPIQIAVSKFKRRLELAAREECLLFGHPGEACRLALRCYGPLSDLAQRMTNSLTGRKTEEGGGAKSHEQVRATDVLVPVLLHDTGQPAYASLWDDAYVLVSREFSKEVKGLPDAVASHLERKVEQSCQVKVLAGDYSQRTNVDFFWKGAVELVPTFPSLPCLEAVKPKSGERPFGDCVIVMAQHLLEETGSLIQALLEIGGEGFEKHVFIIGKPYSSNVRVRQRIRNLGVQVEDLLYDHWTLGSFTGAWMDACTSLWRKVQTHLHANGHVKKVLILDDGGMLHKTVPTNFPSSVRLAGVEQTSAGQKAAAHCGFPVVGVFCCAAKRRLEPRIVADTVWKKLRVVLPQACAAQRMAVCGVGNVGGGLLDYLKTTLNPQTQTLLWWDMDQEKPAPAASGGLGITKADSLDAVFSTADVVFGCAGADLTKDLLNKIAAIKDGRTRYLISCSSNDIEFASLLQQAKTKRVPDIMPFDLAIYENEECRETAWLIPQAGFPITFDRAPSAAPIELMQLTRGLLLAGLLQASEAAKNRSTRNRATSTIVPLDAQRQIAVVISWKSDPTMPAALKPVRERCISDSTSQWTADNDEVKRWVEQQSQPP